jgi:hypothetical protein
MHTAPSHALDFLPVQCSWCSCCTTPLTSLFHLRFAGTVQRRIAEVQRRARISGINPQSSSTSLLVPSISHHSADFVPLRCARSEHCLPPRQLGRRDHVVHIRFLCGSSICFRRHPYHLFHSIRQEQVLICCLRVATHFSPLHRLRPSTAEVGF